MRVVRKPPGPNEAVNTGEMDGSNIRLRRNVIHTWASAKRTTHAATATEKHVEQVFRAEFVAEWAAAE
jgi:hypothetical protein